MYTFVRGFGIASFMFLYPLYLISLGYDVKDIGGFTTYGSLIILFFIPLFGYLVDLGWSREIILLSGLALGSALILPVLFPYYYALLLSYTLLYTSMYTWMPGRMKSIAYIVPSTFLGRVYGFLSMIFTGTRSITPFILGRITYIGYNYLMFWSGLLIICLSIILYIGLLYSMKYIKREHISGSELLRNYKTLYSFNGRKTFPLVLFAGIDSLAWRLWFPLVNAYFRQYRGLSDSEIGDFMGFMGIIMLVTSYVAGTLTDRLGPVKSLITYELLGVTGILFLQLDPPLIYISSLFFGFSFTFWITAYNSLITIYHGYRSIGRLRAIIDTTRSIASVPAPVLGGYLMSLNPSLTFTLSIMIMLSAIMPLKMIKYKHVD